MTSIKHIQNFKAFLMLCYIILFVVDSFIHVKLWTIILVPTIIILFLISFPKVKDFNKYLSSILMISGIYLLMKSHIPLWDWTGALVKNAGLTALLLAVPLLSIVFHIVDFSSFISDFSREHVKTNFRFYMFTFLITNFFGIILNVASIPMVNNLLENISGKHPKKVFYRALTRGFCLAQLWAPSFVATAVILQYSGLEWHSYAPVGVVLSAIGMILSTVMARIDTKKYSDNALGQIYIEEYKTTNGRYKGMVKSFGIAASLIVFIISLQYFTGKSMMVIVPLVSIIFPMMLAVLLKKFEIYKERFGFYFDSILPNMNNEIILFTSIGFFGYGLSVSGADKYIPLIIKSTGISNPIILIPFIIILILVLSTIGLHPILTVSAISIAYYTGAIPISQLQLAAVFAVGYFAYNLLSPFSGMILAVASLERKNPLDVGIKLNLFFCLLLICICSIIIIFL